jgi:hypothetical protein
MFRRIISLPVLLVLILALAGPRAAIADRSPGKTLVGTWEVLVFEAPDCENVDPMPPPDAVPVTVDITVVNRDGTVTNTDPALGTGHGIWKGVGHSTFKMKFKTPVMFINVFELLPTTTLTINTRDLTVARGGMTAIGTFEADIEPDKSDIPIQSDFLDDFCGQIVFNRMTFDD